ncbi:MAG: hypothetical protein KatS3mg113_0286 [Planctomycetaceae bacterium]|nr:MAG: hypothetical protein KatS3mg113_0286 [Planctomycetaceae bacterium]
MSCQIVLKMLARIVCGTHNVPQKLGLDQVIVQNKECEA